MSRIGNKHIFLPEGTTLEVNGSKVIVKGKLGEQEVLIPSCINVEINGNEVTIKRESDSKIHKELHGTARSNINNAVVGVNEGFKKSLEIIGIGYRALLQGEELILKVGYSHDIHLVPLKGVKIELQNETHLTVSGANKQDVGQVAALIRDTRRPEPYNGKGIKYSDERIIRKEGKRASAKK